MIRLLVTGATGLIGRELLPVLRGSGEVFALGRSASDLPGYVRCDLSDPEPTRSAIGSLQPAVVVHLAGGPRPSRHDLYRDNVLATVHLLEAAAALRSPPYCIVFGSAAEYGDGATALLDESAPLRPVTEYGRAKVAQTTLAESIARARAVPLTVLRPFNVVSPHLPPSTALGNMRRQLLSAEGPDRQVRCGRLDVVRDFIPLSSVVEVVRRLLERPAPGRVVNLCSGVGVEVGAILAAMGRRLGTALRIVQDPDLAALPAAVSIVGNPAAMREIAGPGIPPTPDALAEVLLGSP
jgi:nucleoside-diphosphate-sugar epimerase